MTQRTENPQKSPVERAVEGVLQSIDLALTREHQNHGVQLPEKEFRRIFARYIEGRSMAELCRIFRAQSEQEGGDR